VTDAAARPDPDDAAPAPRDVHARDALLRRLGRRVRLRAHVRAGTRRALDSLPAALQIVVGAVASYAIARWVFGHAMPLIAVTVLITSLGMARDARPRRVLETAVGVTVGIALSEVIVLALGKGAWQLGIVVFATLVVARAVASNPAFAVAAAVQAVLVVLLPDPPGGPFTRSLDAAIAGIVAIAVTALMPRNPRRAVKRDAAALFSVLKESLDGVVEALALGNQAGAELALERLRRTQTLVDEWSASLETASSISRISPWLRRHRGELAAQAGILAAADLATRHLRTITRRVVTVLADGERQPELAGLMGELANAITLLGAELDDPQLAGAARSALVDLAKGLDPTLLGSDAELRETLIVVLVRPLVIDLLVGTGMPAEDARELLPPI
jgi:uncharacterized membrane protein YgaE (UPF0421/DUF939 family)